MRATGNVILKVFPLEVERLLGAIMDEYRDEALTFLKECLGEKDRGKVKATLRANFEVSYVRNKKVIIKE